MADYMLFAIMVLGFGVLAVMLNMKRIKSNQIAEMRARGFEGVAVHKRPGETVREENQKVNGKRKILTAKINDKGFDPDELDKDVLGYYTTELPVASFQDDDGNVLITRARHVRRQTDKYANQNLDYWKNAKIEDLVVDKSDPRFPQLIARNDFVDMMTARGAVVSPEWAELLDLVFTTWKNAVIKKDYKQFNEESLMISLNQQDKPVLGILVKSGTVKVASTKGFTTNWLDHTMREVIDQIKTANP